MLKKQISGFIAYCKVSGFKPKSIEALSLRLEQFNNFVNSCRIKRIGVPGAHRVGPNADSLGVNF